MSDEIQIFEPCPLSSPTGGAIAVAIGMNLDLHETAAKLARPAVVRRFMNAPYIVQGCPAVRERAWRNLTTEHRARAERRLSLIQDRKTLQRQCDDLHDAVFRSATEGEAEVIFAAMLDGLQAARDDVTTPIAAYLVTLSYAHDGDDDNGLRNAFSTRVLASAAVRIWSRHGYSKAPLPSEVLEAARAARGGYLTAFTVANRALELRLEAESVIDFFEDEEELAAIMRGERDDDDDDGDFGGAP